MQNDTIRYAATAIARAVDSRQSGQNVRRDCLDAATTVMIDAMSVPTWENWEGSPFAVLANQVLAVAETETDGLFVAVVSHVAALASIDVLRADSPVTADYVAPIPTRPTPQYTGPTKFPRVDWSDAVVKSAIVNAMQNGKDYFNLANFSGGRFATPVGQKRELGQDNYADALVEIWYGGCDIHPNRSKESARSSQSSTAPLMIDGQSIRRDRAYGDGGDGGTYTVASQLQAIADGTYVGFVGHGRSAVKPGDRRADGYLFGDFQFPGNSDSLPKALRAALVQNGETARNRAEQPAVHGRLNRCGYCLGTGKVTAGAKVKATSTAIGKVCTACAVNERINGRDRMVNQGGSGMVNGFHAEIRRAERSKLAIPQTVARETTRIINRAVAAQNALVNPAPVKPDATLMPLTAREATRRRNRAAYAEHGGIRHGRTHATATTAATLRPVVNVTDARRANDEARADAAAWAATDAMKRNGCGYGIHADDK